MKLGGAPYIRPLANLQDEYEEFVVVAADNDGTRILLVSAESIASEDSVKGGVKNRVKKGGWSQKRYARRREKELHVYTKEVAEDLADMHRADPIKRLVLLGSQETLREIEAHLPESVAEAIIGKQGVDLHEGDTALSRVGPRAVLCRGARRGAGNLARDRGAGHGPAVSVSPAPRASSRLATMARVDTILVTRDAKIAGMKCRDCEHVVHGTPSSCQKCGGKSLFELDLVDELARLAEKTGASVDFADPLEGLTRAGDVAALLRY